MDPRESQLRAEVEAASGRLRQVNGDMLLLEAVPTNPRDFSKAATNLLIVRTGSVALPYLVLIDEDLRYRGRDSFLMEVFAEQPPANGWRPLRLGAGQLPGGHLTGVARSALRLLGFPPRPADAEPFCPGLTADWGLRPAYLPLVGRSELLERAEAALMQAVEPVAVVLAGAPGAGKTALVRELAWRWQEAGAGRVAYRADLPALLAEAPSVWTLRERLQRIYEDVRRRGPTMLVLEDFHLAAADHSTRRVFGQAVEAGLRVCGTIALPQFRTVLAHRDWRRRLHALVVPEPTLEELAGDILPAVARYLQTRYGLRIAPEALPVALRQSRTAFGAQPGKAIRILDHALALARLRELDVLGPDDVLP